MPKNDKCDVTACIYIKFDRMNNLPARGVEGLPIEGDRMDQNHQIGKDERLWIQTHILLPKCLEGSTMSTLMVKG